MKSLIHSQTSTVAPLKFGNGYVISSLTLLACEYISMLGLKLIHVSERVRRPIAKTDIRHVGNLRSQFNPTPSYLDYCILGDTNTGERLEQFLVVHTLKSGMKAEPHTWYFSQDTHPETEAAQWRLTSHGHLCSSHRSTWAQTATITKMNLKTSPTKLRPL